MDAGKSTLLGVLTHGELDNGRGTARQKLFRHKHEMESGRTSSVGNDILGFNQEGRVVNRTDGHGELRACVRAYVRAHVHACRVYTCMCNQWIGLPQYFQSHASSLLLNAYNKSSIYNLHGHCYTYTRALLQHK